MDYLNRQQAFELKTEKEWKENAQRIQPMDYDILQNWSVRSKDPDIKKYLYEMAVSAYHKDEGYDI